MKNIFLIILGVMLISSLVAQDNLTRHRVCFDLGGSASMANIEYQFQIHSNERHSVFAAAGMGMNLTNFTFPLGLNYGFGYENQLMLGLYFIPKFNSAILSSTADPIQYLFSPKFGFRKILNGKKNSHLIQVFFSPSFDLQSGTMLPGAGLGFGLYL